MANTYSDVIPKILGRAVAMFRARSLLPRLANRDYDGVAATPGAIINVPIPPTMTATVVSASASQPSNVDNTFATTPVAIDKHYEVPFHFTDVQRNEIMAGTESMAIDAAINALGRYIDQDVMTALDLGASIATGTAATTPYATLALALDPLQYLDTHLMDPANRHCVFNPRANMNLLGLAGFTSRDYVGDVTQMLDGTWNGNRVAGAQWWMSQNCPTHTAGTGASYAVNNVAGYAIGDTAITVDTGSGTILAGDVISFSGDTVNKYVVATALAANVVTIAAPGLKKAIANDETITVSASHTANFVFSRDAVVFASRPFLPSAAAVAMDQVTDPITGLSFRVEVTRQNKQDKWSIDAQWGRKVVRSHGVIKVMG